MKIYDNLEQGTEEWLKIRAGKFTASSFHTCFGKSETRNTLLLKISAERLTGKMIEENYTNSDIERGVELEDEARSLYQEKTFNSVKEIGFAELDDWVGSSPDGLIGDDGMIEIKCPRETTFLSQVINDRIKPEYITQIQFNMYVLNRKWCDYVIYNEDLGLNIKRVERDEEYIKKIIECIEVCKNEVIQNINIYNKGK